MKDLKNKSEITAKNLKEQDCDYKGSKLSFDKKEGFYTVGSWFNSGLNFYSTIRELKMIF